MSKTKEERIKELQDQLKVKKDKLSSLPKQAQIKNMQISLLGKEASNPSTTSEDPKNISVEKSKAKAAKSAEKSQRQTQLDDILKDQMPQLKNEIRALENEIRALKSTPETEENKLETTLKTGVTENIKKQKMAKLTKKDIFRMVENSEPTKITKKEILENIQKTLLKEGMDDNLRRKIERGETDYSEHLDPETIRRISNDIISDVTRNFEAKTGRRVNLQNATRVLFDSLSNVLQKEVANKRELENLAIKLVSEEYNVPVGSVDFKAEITGHPQLGGREITKTGLKMNKGTKRPPEGKTEEELKPNVTKRRLINAMIHGAARKGQNLFHLASDELNRIDPDLVSGYGNIMASNDFIYWALDDDTIKREGQSGTHAGQVRVYPHGKPPAAGKKPLIEAEGMTFPFLLHELTKGVIELITTWGREQDKETRDYVEDKTDNLESETMDIRLGSRIWEKFLDILDVDHLAYKAEILQKISQLPATEFSELINNLMNDDPEAIENLKDIVFGVIREKNEEAVEQAFSEYRDDDDDDKPETVGGDDDEDPILKSLITKKEENVDNPETWSKRDLEDARDEALDSGDYKAVAYLQSILDKKFG